MKAQKKEFEIELPFCAQNKTRTCTPKPALPPQSSVSTNFTIWASLLCDCKYTRKFEIERFFLNFLYFYNAKFENYERIESILRI